nr:hypothetical protein [Tanacetum cinerariifolium]
MAEPILKKYMENAQADSNPTKPNTNDDMNIELNKQLLMELKSNAYHRMFDEDVVDYIAKGDNWGIDPLKFISRVNSSFENHMKVDGRTKKESVYGNPLNTATDSFFKAHDEHGIEEGNAPRQMKRKEDNKNDDKPNKRVSKAEKFEAIKYLLGPTEEYIAIRRCEYNAWERNEDSSLKSTKKFFRKRTTDER